MNSENFGHARLPEGRNVMDFLAQNLQDQLSEEAYYHACPQPGRVSVEYGTVWTLERYASCNAWFRMAFLDPAEELNPALYQQLTTSVPRIPGEAVGFYEEGAVPDSHEVEMSPLSTPWGYALPRILIAQFGKRGEDREAYRMLRGIKMASKMIAESSTPVQLLTKLAEAYSQMGAHPDEVLSHVLSPGILAEENCKTLFKEVVRDLEKNAPVLWSHYQKIPQDQLAIKDILDISSL